MASTRPFLHEASSALLARIPSLPLRGHKERAAKKRAAKKHDDENDSLAANESPSARVSARYSGSVALDRGLKTSELGHTLRVVEKLRADLAEAGVECPGIAVIGAQNAGKSSLLESLTGISFPRGEGLCTRCPIIVSLEVDEAVARPTVTLATDAAYTQESVAFELSDESKHAIRDALRERMRAVSGGKVTDAPVYAKVVRREGATLTMCDLPGITALHDAQHDVEEATTGLTER